MNPPHKKVFDESIREMRTKYEAGGVTLASLALQYGLSAGRVRELTAQRDGKYRIKLNSEAAKERLSDMATLESLATHIGGIAFLNGATRKFRRRLVETIEKKLATMRAGIGD